MARGRAQNMRELRSLPVAMKLRMSSARELYFEGDTMRGEVVLAVHAECSVRGLKVELVCTEEVHVPPRGRRVLELYRHAHTLVEHDTLQTASHCFSFTLRVPNKQGHYPPSLCVPGLSDCSVQWCVKASAEFAMPRAQLSTQDAVAIRVYPLPSYLETVQFGRRTSGENVREDITCTICKPAWIPQAPDMSDIVVVLKLRAPALVRSVEAYMEGRVVMWVGRAARSHVWRLPLGTVCINKVVDNVELDGRARAWQLHGPLPAAFSSPSMHLQYSLCVSVDRGTGAMPIVRLLDAMVASPGGRTRVCVAAPPGYDREGAPPVYINELRAGYSVNKEVI